MGIVRRKNEEIGSSRNEGWESRGNEVEEEIGSELGEIMRREWGRGNIVREERVARRSDARRSERIIWVGKFGN